MYEHFIDEQSLTSMMFISPIGLKRVEIGIDEVILYFNLKIGPKAWKCLLTTSRCSGRA